MKLYSSLFELALPVRLTQNVDYYRKGALFVLLEVVSTLERSAIIKGANIFSYFL